MKRILCLLITLTMLMSILPIQVIAEDEGFSEEIAAEVVAQENPTIADEAADIEIQSDEDVPQETITETAIETNAEKEVSDVEIALSDEPLEETTKDIENETASVENIVVSNDENDTELDEITATEDADNQENAPVEEQVEETVENLQENENADETDAINDDIPVEVSEPVEEEPEQAETSVEEQAETELSEQNDDTILPDNSAAYEEESAEETELFNEDGYAWIKAGTSVYKDTAFASEMGRFSERTLVIFTNRAELQDWISISFVTEDNETADTAIVEGYVSADSLSILNADETLHINDEIQQKIIDNEYVKSVGAYLLPATQDFVFTIEEANNAEQPEVSEQPEEPEVSEVEEPSAPEAQKEDTAPTTDTEDTSSAEENTNEDEAPSANDGIIIVVTGPQEQLAEEETVNADADENSDSLTLPEEAPSIEQDEVAEETIASEEEDVAEEPSSEQTEVTEETIVSEEAEATEETSVSEQAEATDEEIISEEEEQLVVAAAMESLILSDPIEIPEGKEELEIDDMDPVLVNAGRTAFITKAYQELLGRTPGDEEVMEWIFNFSLDNLTA